MKFLLDVNVLVAWGWDDHPHNMRVRKWIGQTMASPGALFHTSPIAEIGFIRVSMHKSVPQIEIGVAAGELENLTRALGKHHRFLTDDLSSRRDFPAWCKSPKHTTDAHLLTLAEKHGLQLATLDTGIPGAFVIPE
jgi:predicted nucleic acid-binding protein